MLTLAAAATLALVGSALYIAIGAHFLRRARLQRQPVLACFALFWLGIGAYGSLEGGWSLAVGLGAAPLEVGITILHLKVLLGALAFFGLVAYCASVYTGRDVVALTAAGYALVYVLVDGFYVWQRPVGQAAGRWGASLSYANPHGAAWTAVVLLLFVPPVVATVGYVLLVRATPDRATRRRIVAIGGSLTGFLGGVTLGWLFEPWSWWGLVEKLLAVATALVALGVIRSAQRPIPIPDS